MMSPAETAKRIFTFVKTLGQEFVEDECPRQAAALAYYTAFSLPPLLVLVLTITGFVYDADRVKQKITSEVKTVLNEDGAAQVNEMITAADEKKKGWIDAIVGTVALLFGATGAMAQLQISLNKAWEVEPDPKTGGVKTFALKRLFSFGMLIVIAFLLLVSLVLSAVLSAIHDTTAAWLPGPIMTVVLMLANGAISFLVVTALFACILKFLPDAQIAWRDVLAGAIFTTALFAIGKWVLGFYLGNSNVGSAFGQAKSLALIMLWVYYSAMIVLLGAEFTQVWARSFGGMIRPAEGAVRSVTHKTHLRPDGQELKSETN